MGRAVLAQVALCAIALAGAAVGACGSSGDDGASSSSGSSGPGPSGTPTTNPTTPPTMTVPPDPPLPPGSAPRPVKIARTTKIPACTSFVDTASGGTADGSAQNPFKTIGAAVSAAAAGAVICVAEGTYAEKLSPGTKYFTLAGGFQHGMAFKVRDSAMYVTKAQGSGGIFLDVADPGPMAGQLTAVDGFEITGYSQAIRRNIYYSQKFDITNNNIHDNTCAQPGLTGAGFELNNVTGAIRGNVIAKNSCTRGGAGSVDDTLNANTVTFESNLVDGNNGTEPMISHGGGLYVFANKIAISGNEFRANSVTGWGGGLYVGAVTGAGQTTTATLTWNVYRSNKAGIAGGGIFCDDSATCLSDHEIYDKNCGGNVYVDSGPTGTGPTVAKFDHLTNVSALAIGCGGPGPGVQITKDNIAADTYTFTNSLFWGNAGGADFDAACNSGCGAVKVTVGYSSVQTSYLMGGTTVTFGAGNIAPADPMFVDAAMGDFHLKSTHGHWTPNGYVNDAVESPALAKGDPAGAVNGQPPSAGDRTELGAYGNSGEASYVK